MSVSPLRDHIEKWLNSALIKITEENQTAAVGLGEEIVARQNIREITPQK